MRKRWFILGTLFCLPLTGFGKGDLRKGQTLYQQMCSACHQPDGKGKPGLGPRLNSPDLLFLASDDFFRKSILEGRPGTAMMSYKLVPQVADQVEDLLAYIRSWESQYPHYKRTQVDWKGTIKRDKLAGKKSFRTFCASCHGPNGGGYADGGSGLAIGLSGFLRVASDDFIKKTMMQGRAGTGMKSFGHGRPGIANISDSDINNIVAYLRSLE